MANNLSSDDLRELARRYEAAARKLHEAADSIDGIIPSVAQSHFEPKQHALVAVKRGSRFAQLKDFLRNHGPMSRSEIIGKSGIPAGTLGQFLKPPDFDKDEDGNWFVREERDAEET